MMNSRGQEQDELLYRSAGHYQLRCNVCRSQDMTFESFSGEDKHVH